MGAVIASVVDVLGWWFGLLGLGLVGCAVVLVLVMAARAVTGPALAAVIWRAAAVTAVKCAVHGVLLSGVAVVVFGWGL